MFWRAVLLLVIALLLGACAAYAHRVEQPCAWPEWAADDLGSTPNSCYGGYTI